MGQSVSGGLTTQTEASTDPGPTSRLGETRPRRISKLVSVLEPQHRFGDHIGIHEGLRRTASLLNQSWISLFLSKRAKVGVAALTHSERGHFISTTMEPLILFQREYEANVEGYKARWGEEFFTEEKRFLCAEQTQIK